MTDTYEQVLNDLNAIDFLLGQAFTPESITRYKESLTAASVATAYRIKTAPENVRRITEFTPDSVSIYDVGSCPVCGADVRADQHHYCPDCGQALKWEEE